MAIKRSEKEEAVGDLKEIFDSAESIVFVKFHGLPVSASNEMRRELRSKGVGYRVAKKTLTGRALKDSKIEGEMPELEGELAIAYSNDETGAAREIYSFQKKLEGAVSIEGGVFQNAILSKAKMVEIAEIPSMDVLRGMFVNLINSPIQRFAVVLGQIAESRS